jgi:hypothetical protein
MDPSTSPVQGTQIGRTQQPAVVQPGNMSQSSPDPVVQSIPTPQTISVHPEQGPVQTGGTQAEDNEDEVVQPAKQEVSSPVGQQSADEAVQAVEVQEVEVQPSVPELKVEKSVEHIVEKSPDHDKPKLPEEVKAVGVTHSGPGVPIDQNVFGVKNLPMTYDQAIVEEKQHPKLNDSKHWLAELVLYVWRKLDPTYGKQKGEKQENKFWKILN